MEYLEYLLFSSISIGMFFIIILLFLLLGRYVATHQFNVFSVKVQKKTKITEDIKVFEATIYTIMGLLIAFTFSGANLRVDEQRKLIIEQIDSIIATRHFLDVLPQPVRKEAQEVFNKYLDGQIKWYKNRSTAADKENQRQIYLQSQQKLWHLVVDTCIQRKISSCNGLLRTLNNMMALENKVTLYKHIHPPLVIYLLLFCIVLLSSFLAGYRIRDNLKQTWIHLVIFSLILSIMIFMIMNLEFPHLGVFSVNIFGNFNEAFLKLRSLL
ncbi:hypothetical protein [Legionella bononiensis]|uniref:bestrophin-like domain n=1 Tax=Legionella bononiensis TaxID=2793102 RepID=UPI0019336CF4|nr:hypothetical protein [Legionella bononiensis]MBL7480580.1 hypothetical protein [Legionella bononiensis]